ncbi:dead box ATP-dependent RNA helicase, putative [Ricinus communis]|uniref:Dead box ATP-dependent RNA helicase, putative n=1 Tax=Ricinus communis TaxID=3988 RepID=B9SM72_RICCO|nr:dead box ATP-dependent RNA helicase, putative [Ricinus communis]|eukprot:XP_002527091.1 DEAD-box ATP-dependent RNA helicase 39 isoform X1 [Ricinus communis]
MKRTLKAFVNLALSSQSHPPLPIRQLSVLRALSTTTTTTTRVSTESKEKESKKDSFILEKFRQRKLQGSLKTTIATTTKQQERSNCRADVVVGSKSEASIGEVVSGFEELGLKEEVAMAAGELGVWVPTEIQCVGIPAILEGKSLVLSSNSGSGRTLSYLLPLVQLLRGDEALSGMKPKQPKAIVLCTTEELSDEGFRIAKSISDFARLSRSGSDHLSPENMSKPPIGMLIGTPFEVVQQIEEGSIATDDIKYLVLDNADAMFDNGFGPEISRIISSLKNRKSQSNDQRLQTVLVTDTMTEVLGKSGILERLEHDNAGKVTAIVLKIDQMEAFEIIKSSDALKKKMAEAIDSFASGS